MKYERRLYKLAVRQGRCPVHCTPLLCVRCHVQDDLTPEEAREALAFFQRLTGCYEPDPPLRAYGVCLCGGLWVCDACTPWPPVGATQYRDHELTAAELDRFFALLGRVQLTKP